MAPYSSTLAWKIPWAEEPGRLQSMASQSRTWLSDFTFTFHFHALEKEMATHSSVLAWRIPGSGEPVGLPSMGSHRVGHDWSDLAAAAAEVLLGNDFPAMHYLSEFLNSCESKWSHRVNSHKENEGEPILSTWTLIDFLRLDYSCFKNNHIF